MIIVPGDRQTGRTTHLVEWLIEGRENPRWPGWSRVLVVASNEMVAWTARHFREQDARLREKFEPGLGKLVLAPGEARRAFQIGGPELEVAVDDADFFISNHLGGWPAIVSIQGEIAEGR